MNARERVRLAIRCRLDDLHMTNRHFGKQFTTGPKGHHVDTWVTSLLKGQTALSLDELDEAARILKTTPAQLVKSEFEQAEYLTPTEHRIIEAVRIFPPAVRDHFLLLAEYLIGVLPEEIEFLRKFRGLPLDRKDAVRHSVDVFHMSRMPEPELAILPGAREKGERPTDAEHRIRTRAGQRRRKGEKR